MVRQNELSEKAILSIATQSCNCQAGDHYVFMQKEALFTIKNYNASFFTRGPSNRHDSLALISTIQFFLRKFENVKYILTLYL